MKKFLITFSSVLMACFLLCAANNSKKSAKPPIRALLITGGCCHDYPNQQEIIPAGIDERVSVPVEWTIVHQRTKKGDVKIPLYENPDWAKDYDVVVHNECFAKIGDEKYIESILKPHRDGVPALLVHCTMHCYRTGSTKEEWFKFCGVHSPRHGKKHPFEVKIKAPEHEIMKGQSNWTTKNGELYYIQKTFPTMTPLAESVSKTDGNTYANIWVNAYGPNKTRIFATTIGHHNETMQQPEYLNMITRGFLWAAGKKVDELHVKK
ncbi:MAG: ThuA domain-containing protein [Planctomycetes bacterium]|nr:ThuA domain-containing protein [Planctomycetota bacterium]